MWETAKKFTKGLGATCAVALVQTAIALAPLPCAAAHSNPSISFLCEDLAETYQKDPVTSSTAVSCTCPAPYTATYPNQGPMGVCTINVNASGPPGTGPDPMGNMVPCGCGLVGGISAVGTNVLTAGDCFPGETHTSAGCFPLDACTLVVATPTFSSTNNLDLSGLTQTDRMNIGGTFVAGDTIDSLVAGTHQQFNFTSTDTPTTMATKIAAYYNNLPQIVCPGGGPTTATATSSGNSVTLVHASCHTPWKVGYTRNSPACSGSVTFTPSPIDFLSTPVGIPTAAQSITITNQTGSALNNCSVASSDPANFTLSNTAGCTNLANNTACTVSYQGSPATAGTHNSTLKLSCSAGRAYMGGNFQVAGTGVAPPPPPPPPPGGLTIMPLSQDFQDVIINTSTSAQTFTILNGTNNTVNQCNLSFTPGAGTVATDFTSTNSCGGALPKGKSCTFTVAASPGTVGVKSTTAAFVCTGPKGGNVSANISVNGVVLPTFVIDINKYDFGSLAANAKASSSTLTLTNNGSLDALNCSLAQTNPNPARFSFSPANACSSIAAGGTCSFKLVATAPAVTGATYKTSINFTCKNTSSKNTYASSPTNFTTAPADSYTFGPPTCAFPGQYDPGTGCQCPADYELTKVNGGSQACRPVVPSLDFYKKNDANSDGYPVCGAGRLPVDLNYLVSDVSSNYQPKSANQDDNGAYGIYKYAKDSSATTHINPIYDYAGLTRCVCTSNPYELAGPTGTGVKQSPNFGNPGSTRFWPDDFDTIRSQDRLGGVNYSMVAIARDGVSNGSTGDIFAAAAPGGAACGCPNINEYYTSNQASPQTTWTGSTCKSMMDPSDSDTNTYKILTTFNPTVHQTSGTNQQVFSAAREPIDSKGNIVSNIKLNTVNGGYSNYQRRIWTCAPPYVPQSNGGVLKCVFDASKHACDNGSGSGTPSVVSKTLGIVPSLAFDNAVNKKLACCLNDFDPSDPLRTQKFDCIDNSAPNAYTSFDDLWKRDVSATDQPNAVVLTNSSGKLMTGFYTLTGAHCDEFSEFGGTLIRATVNPMLMAGQQKFVGTGGDTDIQYDSSYAISPPASLMANFTSKGKRIPTDVNSMRRCPILARAAMKATCPAVVNPPNLPAAITSINSGGVTRCPVAASVQIQLRIEQIYEISGTPRMKTIDSFEDSTQALNIDVGAMIRNKTMGSCPAGSVLASDGTCTYQ